MTSRLFLLRHAAVRVPPGICYGRSDVPLAEPVTDHARKLRALLPHDAAIVSSPLARCRSLAEALGATDLDARLMELDFGEWELRSYAELPRGVLDEWAADPWGFRPPGGETGEEMIARVLACLDERSARHAALAIVAHGGPLRAIAGHLLRLPRARWLAQTMPLGCCLYLERIDSLWRSRALTPASVMPAGTSQENRFIA